jgi:hypothetical protein
MIDLVQFQPNMATGHPQWAISSVWPFQNMEQWVALN